MPSSLPKLREIQAELARRNLRDFIEYTFPAYDFGWFNEELAEKLQQFVEVSIHAPVMGATKRNELIRQMAKFQSTHP